MATKVEDLKEVKLPTYKIGVNSRSYRIQLLGAASSRGRAKDVYEGRIREEKQRHQDALEASTATPAVGT